MRVFFASIALITFSTAARAEAASFDDSDYTRLSYGPATVPAGLCESSQQYNASCAGQWWKEPAKGDLNYTKTTHKTFGGGDKAPTLSFTFRGSNVTVYGVKSKNGARAIVKLDRLLRYINTTSIDGKYHVGRKLFSQSGLDPNVNHTVSIEFNTATYDKQAPGPDTQLRYLAIDFIRVDMPDPSDDAGDTEQDDSSSRSSSRTVRIALGTVCGICGAIVLGGIAFIAYRRRQRARRFIQDGGSYVNIDSERTSITPLQLPQPAHQPEIASADKSSPALLSRNPSRPPPPYSSPLVANFSTSSLSYPLHSSWSAPTVPPMAVGRSTGASITSTETSNRYESWYPPTSVAQEVSRELNSFSEKPHIQCWTGPLNTTS